MARRQTLEHLQTITTIVATIATPLFIAYFGWRFQNDLTTQGIKKDYVQMSISILKDGTKDEQLRKWAVSVVDANSPIKFSPSLKSNLEQGKTIIVPAPYPMPPPELMEPPKPLKSISKRPITVGDLLENDVENDGIAKDNAIQLWYLQQVIKAYGDATSGKTPSPIQRPDYIMESGMRGVGQESSPAYAASATKK
jgi:hypothetical protein